VDNPISTVQDKEIETAEFLAKKEQPVHIGSQNYFRGFLDIFSRCIEGWIQLEVQLEISG